MEKRYKKGIPRFIRQLWVLLNDNEYSQPFIKWNDTEEIFCKEIIQRYFNKKAKFASFVRQLNMYHFKKIQNNSNKLEWRHSLFRRNHKQLLIGIKRKPTQLQLQEQERLLENVYRREAETSNFCRKKLTSAHSSENQKKICHQNQKQIFPTSIPSKLKLQSLQDPLLVGFQQNQPLSEIHKNPCFSRDNFPQSMIPSNQPVFMPNFNIGVEYQNKNSDQLIPQIFSRLWIPTYYIIGPIQYYWTFTPGGLPPIYLQGNKND